MIHSIGQALSHWKSGPPALVLHLGAGSGGSLPTLLSILRPARLVLLEGDPDLQRSLSTRVQQADAIGSTELLATAVSPDGGPLDWKRYSLGALTGPVDHSALGTVYPRLRLLEKTFLSSISISDAISRALALQGSDPGPRLLLLDLPGQEDALLAAVAPGMLAGFDAVVVCGGGRALTPSAVRGAIAPGSSTLPTRGFRLVWSDHESEPLWPVAFWQLIPLQAQAPAAGLAGAAMLPLAAAPTTRPEPATANAHAPHPGADPVAPESPPARAPVNPDTLTRLQRQLDFERERNDALAAQLEAAEAQIEMLKDLLLRETGA